MIESPGKRLRAARLERKLSVEEITNATKMRPSIIQALETDDYSSFPSITHARSFLSLYGKHLNVDVTDGISNLIVPSKMGIENYQYLNVERHEDTTYRPQRRTPRNTGGQRNGEQAPRKFGVIIGAIVFFILAIYLAINLQRLNLASSVKPVETVKPAEIANPFPTATGEIGLKPRLTISPTPLLPETPYFTPTLESRRLIQPRPIPPM